MDKKLDSKNNKNAVFFRPWAIGFLLLLCAQIAYGAFVSGMKAGYGFNIFNDGNDGWKVCSDLLLTGKISLRINSRCNSFIAGWAQF